MMSLNIWRISHQQLTTYPRAVGNQFKDGLKGEAHGKCKVHVGEEVGQEKRSAVKLYQGQNCKGLSVFTASRAL